MRTFASLQHPRFRSLSSLVVVAFALGAALLSGGAQATVAGESTVTAVLGGTPGAYTLTYSVYNGKEEFYEEYDYIRVIDIPELALGDLDFTKGLPTGWSFKEYSNGPFAGSGGKAADDTPYYIELSSNNGIETGHTLQFTAQIKTSDLVDATFALGHSYQDFYSNDHAGVFGSYSESVDPPIPGPTNIPEPSSTTLTGLGILALVAATRRGVRLQSLHS